MTSFTFTPEQLRAAPPEVRRWIVQEIVQALAAAERPAHDASQVQVASLAVCTAEEALHVFELVRSNFLITQVFFELARDAAPGPRVPPLHPLNTGDILRHTRLTHSDGLIECLSAINEAFRQIRRDPDTSLFGFDGYGHVYIHETTHLSIRRLWEQLVRPAPPVTSGAVKGPARQAASFAVPEFAPRVDTSPSAAEEPGNRAVVSDLDQPSGPLRKQAPLQTTPATRPPPGQPHPSRPAQEVALAANPRSQKLDRSATEPRVPKMARAPTARQRARKP